MLLRPGKPAGAGPIVDITRVGFLGNPFLMRDEAERGAVVDAYGSLVEGCGTVDTIAHDYGTARGPLEVHTRCGAVDAEQRQGALRKLLAACERSVRGAPVQLRCSDACRCGRRCHGEVIREWVADRIGY